MGDPVTPREGEGVVGLVGVFVKHPQVFSHHRAVGDAHKSGIDSMKRPQEAEMSSH